MQNVDLFFFVFFFNWDVGIYQKEFYQKVIVYFP